MKIDTIDPISIQERAEGLGLTQQQWRRSMKKETQLAVAEVKKRKAPKIKAQQWREKGYAFSNLTHLLSQCQRSIDIQQFHLLSLQKFRQHYQSLKIPLLIQGCTQYWKANTQWTLPSLLQKYGHIKFKVAEDQDGQKLKLTLKQYIEYMLHNQDDSPLYLFQQGLKSPQTLQLQSCYNIPPFFKQDLFEMTYQQRPPYRWLIIGPQRSGTPVHIDPLMTSAWNTSIIGRKRWVLFAANIPKWIVRGENVGDKKWNGQASYYFVEVLPKIKEKYGKELGLIEFIQQPGETVFIPGGMWHAVLNLTDTLAITQNYAPSSSFESIWRVCRKRTPDFASTLLKALQHDVCLVTGRKSNYSKGRKLQISKIAMNQEIDTQSKTYHYHLLLHNLHSRHIQPSTRIASKTWQRGKAAKAIVKNGPRNRRLIIQKTFLEAVAYLYQLVATLVTNPCTVVASNDINNLNPMLDYSQHTSSEIHKIIVVGQSGAGKSHIVYCLCCERLPKTISPTITLEFNTQIVRLDTGKTAKIQIWDTIGQEQFRSLTINQYRHSRGALLIFDVTNRRSFERLPQWVMAVTQRAEQNVQIGVIGHKCDLIQREVSREEGYQYAVGIGAFYIQTTVKDPTTIRQAFHKLIRNIIKVKNSEAMIIKLSRKQILPEDEVRQCSC